MKKWCACTPQEKSAVGRIRVRGRVRANPNPNSNPHPHPTAQEQFYFSDAVLVQLKSAVYLLKQVMAAREDRDSISVAFPDDGAAKRFNPHLTLTLTLTLILTLTLALTLALTLTFARTPQLRACLMRRTDQENRTDEAGAGP